MGKSQELYKEAKKYIPGGTQLLSKRPELFLPEAWPAYYEKAKGCEIWDLDGNKFVDMTTMGIGTCILGYSDEDVNREVKKCIDKGNMSSLNPPEEVELAKLLCELHPWASMARFARSGGEAMSIAVRIGRAKSKKDKILFCGYHGWHDWYLSSNLSDEEALDGHLLPGLEPLGVPRLLKDSAISFNYNNTEEFEKLIHKYKGQIGVVVLEAIRNEEPKKEFIERIQSVSQKEGIVFIVDEITSGFRLNLGGSHLLYDIEPDIAVFAKGISNGFPMAAVIGKKEVMDVAQGSFISSTYWTEKIGSVAALTTLEKMKKENVQDHITNIGRKIQEEIKILASQSGIEIKVSGIFPLTHFSFVSNEALVLKTLFTQEMLKKGFLASTSIYTSFAQKNDTIEKYLLAVKEVFNKIASAIKENKTKSLLEQPVCHTGFKRLN